MADKKFGAGGTIRGRFLSLEKKISAAGKSWAMVEIDVDGHKVKARSFSDDAIKALSGLAKNESFPFWGKVNSSLSTQGKMFTNLQIAKVYDDDREGYDSIMVHGIVKDMGNVMSSKDPSKMVGKFVDIDITQEEKYPEMIRLQLAFGFDTTFQVGDKVAVEAFMDKFGIWVFEGDIKKESNSRYDADTKVQRRSNRPAPQRSGNSAPADEPAAPEGSSGSVPDDDIPW